MDKTKQIKPGNQGLKPQLTTLVRPYMKMIVLLVLFALIGNGFNLVIPKIISHGIDSFSGGHYQFKTIAIEFLSATLVIFIFTYLQSVVQTYTSEKVARDLGNGYLIRFHTRVIPTSKKPIHPHYLQT